MNRSFRYTHREEPGVQLPCQTLAWGTGSYAVLMMEAARHWGWGAICHGLHPNGGRPAAWTEIYLPGAGWCGFDPTNNKLVGFEHVPVAVASEHQKASPLSGTWEGPPDAFDRMKVSVQVVSL